MLFYVFENKDKSFTANTSKALYSTNDVDAAFEVFNKSLLTGKYCNLFLVVDFKSNERKQGLFNLGVVDINDFDESVPFIVLSEYHADNSNNYIAPDKIMIVNSRGISRTFRNDGYGAIKKIIDYYDSRTPVDIYAVYKVNNGWHYYNQFVTNTINIDSGYQLSKIKIKPFDAWKKAFDKYYGDHKLAAAK